MVDEGAKQMVVRRLQLHRWYGAQSRAQVAKFDFHRRLARRHQYKGTVFARQVQQMEQGAFIDIGRFQVFDHERAGRERAGNLRWGQRVSRRGTRA